MKTSLKFYLILIFLGLSIAFFLLKKNRKFIALQANMSMLRVYVLTHPPPHFDAKKVQQLFVQATRKLKNGKVEKRKLVSFEVDFQRSIKDDHLDETEVQTLLRDIAAIAEVDWPDR